MHGLFEGVSFLPLLRVRRLCVAGAAAVQHRFAFQTKPRVPSTPSPPLISSVSSLLFLPPPPPFAVSSSSTAFFRRLLRVLLRYCRLFVGILLERDNFLWSPARARAVARGGTGALEMAKHRQNKGTKKHVKNRPRKVYKVFRLTYRNTAGGLCVCVCMRN